DEEKAKLKEREQKAEETFQGVEDLITLAGKKFQESYGQTSSNVGSWFDKTIAQAAGQTKVIVQQVNGPEGESYKKALKEMEDALKAMRDKIAKGAPGNKAKRDVSAYLTHTRVKREEDKA
ncbi:unnamed protein product, partial [Allacma fusca]